jgi:hypothetical protein
MKIKIVLILLITFLTTAKAYADSQSLSRLKGVEVLSGFGLAEPLQSGDYHVQPLFMDFNFDIKSSFNWARKLPGAVDFILEPFAAYVYQPQDNAEIGNNFLIKIGFRPEGKRIQPYFKGGLGLIYITQHLKFQGTQFNFNEYAGMGVDCFFSAHWALALEYRFRHVSNAEIKQPDAGFNTNMGLAGLMYQF